MSDMTRPLFVGRCEVERELGVAEARVIVGIVERERHADAIKTDVQVGIDAVAQW